MLRKGKSNKAPGVLPKGWRPKQWPSPMGGFPWGGLTCDGGSPSVSTAKAMDFESLGGQATREEDSEGKAPRSSKHRKYAPGRKHAGKKPE